MKSPITFATVVIIFVNLSRGYGQQFPSPSYNFTSEKEARQIVFRITDAVGLKPNFEIKAGNVDNAAALVYNGKRYIFYNPVFIQQISNSVKTDWGGISILAHEIAHHLNGHTLTGKGSIPSLELEADEFSGYVLRKMGATLRESQAAMRILSSTHDSSTHPGQGKRLASIEKGWYHAHDQLASPNKNVLADRQVRKEIQPAAKTKDTKAVVSTLQKYQFPSRFIHRKIHFFGLPDQQFYITIQSNFIHVGENGYRIIGKAVTSGKSMFLALSDNDYLKIASNGSIFNKQNRRVGYLSN